MNVNKHPNILSLEKSKDTTDALTIFPSTGIITDSDFHFSNPSIDLLTVEIKVHLNLNQMRSHVIEVGKRLIQAKDLLTHDEWQNWLKNNFNLQYRMAANFMEISRRFSKTKSISLLDISTFKPYQLIAMLALKPPHGFLM